MSPQSSTKVVLFAFALALGLTACASGGGGASSRPAGATSSRIVRAEIEALPPMDALTGIQRLRPRWLQSRAGSGAGDPPVLYVDGARRGATTDLATMRVAEVEQMNYMSASDATTRYGTGHGGGAIQVTTRR
ncbi:MAG: hypothetical protein OSA81_05455 [Longimicrobiales bacterium]|nr:hypothetical protein [Longimicrobiales bacterium]